MTKYTSECTKLQHLIFFFLRVCRLTWLSSYMYISTIGNYCMTGSQYHYEYYKTIEVRNKCVFDLESFM